MDYGYANSAAPSTSSFSLKWIAIGILLAVAFAFGIDFAMGRANTRPVKQGFQGGPINGTSALPCGRESSEAEALLAKYSGRLSDKNEDLRDLKNLLSKLTCFKRDLMSPVPTITAVKELGFATHMDIQPVADLTARCMSKTIPGRDLDIQFIKWRDQGHELLARLAKKCGSVEGDALESENLFNKVWNDVQDIGKAKCVGKAPVTMFKAGPHEPAARSPDSLVYLKEQDGQY